MHPLPTRLGLATIGSLAIFSAIVGCRAPVVRTPPPTATPAPSIAVPSVATRYQVDGDATMLHILVYRGGALARLGHNHVLSSRQVGGRIDFDPVLTRSQVELVLPVASLTVDDPDARQIEGEDFATTVPADARAGTRANLLRAEVLDGERYAEVKLRTTKIEGTHFAPILTLQVTLKETTRELRVPVQVRYESSSMETTGEFTLKQTDFGMTPFSIGLGALQVRDEVRIKFRIVARANRA